MTKAQLARCDMFARVRNFGETHREHFPDASVGGQAFAAVATSVTQLNEYTGDNASTTRDRRRAQQIARTALRDQLDAIARTARLIARTRPGFDDPFRLPHQRTDDALLTTGRVFVQSADPLASPFIAHGMPQTFIADVKERIDQLEQAAHDHRLGKSDHLTVQTAIATALSTGMAAVRTLDLIVANQFRDDPVTLAVWERVRRLNARRRAKSGGAVAATTTAVASSDAASPTAAGEQAAPTPATGPTPAAASTPGADPLQTAEKASGIAS